MERDDLSKLDWAAGVLEGMAACYIQADQKPVADKLIDVADAINDVATTIRKRGHKA